MIAIFPELASCAESGDIELLSILVRKYFCTNDKYAPAPNIVSAAEMAGIEISRINLNYEGALVAKDAKGEFHVVAILHDKLKGYEERFMAAHLMGHFFLHVQPLIARGDWQSSGFREDQNPYMRYISASPVNTKLTSQDRMEKEADDFASALLLPKGMVKRAMEKLKSPEKVAEFFQVSVAMLNARCQAIGALIDQPSNFLAAEQQINGTKKGQEQRAVRPPKKAAPSKEEAPKGIKGMDRIRQIARMLDKTP